MTHRSWTCSLLQLVPAVVGVIGAATAANAQSPADAYEVTLHCAGPITLKTAAIAAVYSWAARLVSSSQNNSDAPEWLFPKWEVQQEYRDALSGDYLRVDFASSTTIDTMGGVIHVSAIVLGLDSSGPDWRSKYPDHFTDALFTIDESGTVVGHALYSGADAFALGRAIKKGLPTPDACQRAKVFSLKDAQLPPALQDFLRQNGLQE
jgi:hypothetical protein